MVNSRIISKNIITPKGILDADICVFEENINIRVMMGGDQLVGDRMGND